MFLMFPTSNPRNLIEFQLAKQISCLNSAKVVSQKIVDFFTVFLLCLRFLKIT